MTQDKKPKPILISRELLIVVDPLECDGCGKTLAPNEWFAKDEVVWRRRDDDVGHRVLCMECAGDVAPPEDPETLEDPQIENEKPRSFGKVLDEHEDRLKRIEGVLDSGGGRLNLYKQRRDKIYAPMSDAES